MDPNNLNLNTRNEKAQSPAQTWVPKLSPISFKEKKKRSCVLKQLMHRKESEPR